MLTWPVPTRPKKTQREEDPETAEEDVFSTCLKKTQPKKTPFSNRRNYHTFGTALTQFDPINEKSSDG